MEETVTDEWRLTGDYPVDLFKIKAVCTPSTADPNTRLKKLKPLAISAPIPDVNIGDNVVIVQCIVI